MIRLVILLATLHVGTSFIKEDVRIVGGYNTTIEEFPFQASLQVLNEHYCGAAILTEKFLVTAAHCVPGKDPIKFLIRVGSTYYKEGGTTYNAEKFLIFPNYTAGVSNGDVALIVSRTTIAFSSAVQPIQLVPKANQPRHGDMLTASGWGITTLSYFDRKSSPVLRAVRLPNIRLSYCRAAYNMSSDKITENMLCAGGGVKKLIYKGDSGGPLVNSKKQLVGVVTGGRAIYPTGYPSIFANVASTKIRDFIEQVLNGTVK